MTVRFQNRSVRRTGRLGFTVVELLTGMSVFVVLLAALLTTIRQTATTLQRARNEVGSFQSARFAYSLITRTLSQATLNTYIDYDDPSSPTKYIRKSDLNFLITKPASTRFPQGNAVFFQAKLGNAANNEKYGAMDALLNSVGYYVAYGTDPKLPPFLAALDKNRFRLYQYVQPSDKITVYKDTGNTWYLNDLADNSTAIAENVILALFWPKLSDQEVKDSVAPLTTDYSYDSRNDSTTGSQLVTANQQPPIVQVTLVAIDEVSAARLGNSTTVPDRITKALEGLFSNPESYSADLEKLESRLNAYPQIQYRIFNGTVPLKESKWTNAQ